MRRLSALLITLGSFVLALCVFAFALALLGRPPQATLLAMLSGSFGSFYSFSETLLRTVPVLFCALAAAIPAQSGQINIGGEGQLHLGAIGAVLVAGPFMSGGGFGAMLLMALGAIACGGAWAAIPAVLRARWNVNEALVSLFLNYIAILLLQFLAHGPMRDPNSYGWPMSPLLPASLCLTPFSGTRLHSGIFVAGFVAVLLLTLIYLTRQGTELRAVGLNPEASLTVGIPVARYLFVSMVLGGVLAGLAGYYEIVSVQQRLRLDISLGFGYSGFLVAWICRKQLMLIVPVSILVAALIVGSENLQITSGLPAASGDVAQGFLLLFVLLSGPFIESFKQRRATRLAIEGKVSA
jgi:general nucleoside transport system permease protein